MIFASELMDRARRIIQDETSVRWPLAELNMWINDALREVVLQKPSASSRNRVLTLSPGTYQQIPSDCLALLRVVRNIVSVGEGDVRSGGRAIRVVARDVMDAQHPNWHDDYEYPFKPVVKHYMYDEADPKSFYVFPGNDGTGKIEAVVSRVPDPVVPLLQDVEDIEAYHTSIDMPDIYANAILDYILYRAYSKDAQYAGNLQRAAAHYQQFANSLGIKVQVETAYSPNMSAGIKAVQQGAA